MVALMVYLVHGEYSVHTHLDFWCLCYYFAIYFTHTHRNLQLTLEPLDTKILSSYNMLLFCLSQCMKSAITQRPGRQESHPK
jgi:hypothetical protein